MAAPAAAPPGHAGPAPHDQGPGLRRGLRQRLNQRFQTWLLGRRPATDIWVLGQRNIYILPTPAGLAFALTLLLLLLASMNYQLNLGFVLTFLLVGAAVVSMHMTHNTLRGLTLRLRPPAPCFVGEPATLEVVLSHEGAARHGLGFRLLADQAGDTVWIDVPRASQASAHLRFTAARRGLLAVPAIGLETRFPFGLFRAWTVWRPASPVLAYPRPETPAPPLPVPARVVAQAARPARMQGSELDGVRAYRRGDSMRQIAWKKVARSGELVSRDGQDSTAAELWLDWSQAGLREPEARLSRLCAWVLEAESRGIAYGLRLPATEWPPANGTAQRHAVLAALALWAA